ncbi:hypothetical protein [Streptomyces sp. NPDC058145]|uniref:hypothetical protein n=1 Tax=Streptomyces sp. NPDC058145 TaxID=3346356 RepID=UPI0036EDD1C9
MFDIDTLCRALREAQLGMGDSYAWDRMRHEYTPGELAANALDFPGRITGAAVVGADDRQLPAPVTTSSSLPDDLSTWLAEAGPDAYALMQVTAGGPDEQLAGVGDVVGGWSMPVLDVPQGLFDRA